MPSSLDLSPLFHPLTQPRIEAFFQAASSTTSGESPLFGLPFFGSSGFPLICMSSHERFTLIPFWDCLVSTRATYLGIEEKKTTRKAFVYHCLVYNNRMRFFVCRCRCFYDEKKTNRMLTSPSPIINRRPTDRQPGLHRRWVPSKSKLAGVGR